MVTPTVEWPAERNLNGTESLSYILSQQNHVQNPAFRVFFQVEFAEFLRALPFMSESEKKVIARAIHTDQLIYRVAEAVGRIRSQELVAF